MAAPGNGISAGKGNKNRNEGCHKSHPESTEKNLAVGGREHLLVGVKGELVNDSAEHIPLHEGISDDNCQRHDKKEGEPKPHWVRIKRTRI